MNLLAEKSVSLQLIFQQKKDAFPFRHAAAFERQRTTSKEINITNEKLLEYLLQTRRIQLSDARVWLPNIRSKISLGKQVQSIVDYVLPKIWSYGEGKGGNISPTSISVLRWSILSR